MLGFASLTSLSSLSSLSSLTSLTSLSSLTSITGSLQYSDYADAALGLLFLLVLLEGEGLFHYLVAKTGGVHEVEFAVLAPHGKSKVGNVKAGFVGDEGHYVAVVYATELCAAFAKSRCGYVALRARDRLLCLAYVGHELFSFRCAQGGVVVGMRGHEVDNLILGGREVRTVVGP